MTGVNCKSPIFIKDDIVRILNVTELLKDKKCVKCPLKLFSYAYMYIIRDYVMAENQASCIK